MVRYLERYGRTIPYATGSTVGLAGLILGGGVGLSSRTWGSVASHAIRIHCVMADGNLAWIDAKSADGRAILTAGGSTIVALAEVEVSTHWQPLVTLYSFRWPKADALAVLKKLEEILPDSDARLGFVFRLGSDGAVWLFGQSNGIGLFATKRLLSDLLKQAPTPREKRVITVPHRLASNLFFRVNRRQPQGWHAKIGSQLFKTSSCFASEALPDAISEAFVRVIHRHPKLQEDPEEVSMVQLLFGGGAILNEPDSPHFDARILYQIDGFWKLDTDREPVLNWVAAVKRVLEPVCQGAYVNYVDDTIPVADRPDAYYGESQRAIVETKKRLDPDNFFRNPHGPLT